MSSDLENAFLQELTAIVSVSMRATGNVFLATRMIMLEAGLTGSNPGWDGTSYRIGVALAAGKHSP